MKKIDIFLAGGGSGGHITPLLSVAEELKKKDASMRLAHVGQKGDHLNSVTKQSDIIDEHFYISAGKFRRYHGESFISHIFDVKTLFLNVRDFFRFLKGIIDSLILLKKHRPTVIFMKGGFVCVPLGFVARLYRIPYVTHDSDVIPGLANRLIAGGAYMHTTGMPADEYPYPSEKTRYVGVPVQHTFRPVTPESQQQAKKNLNLTASQVLLVTGGGLGSQKINHAVANQAEALLQSNLTLHIVHLTGHKLFEETRALYSTRGLSESNRVSILPFTDSLAEYSAAADLIICRAGATNMAEFALQAKACVIIPNPVLTGGQQVKNARVYAAKNAVMVLEEQELSRLEDVVTHLLQDSNERSRLSQALSLFAKPNATKEIAAVLYDIARHLPEQPPTEHQG